MLKHMPIYVCMCECVSRYTQKSCPCVKNTTTVGSRMWRVAVSKDLRLLDDENPRWQLIVKTGKPAVEETQFHNPIV